MIDICKFKYYCMLLAQSFMITFKPHDNMITKHVAQVHPVEFFFSFRMTVRFSLHLKKEVSAKMS